jgi:AbrB family looped-hinge helix DNA binding protein
MRTTIDAAGRLVIPRALRDQVGLRSGEVELVVDGAAIRIEPVALEGLAEEGGFLVIPESGIALDDAALREARLVDQR